ncbi:hypothetical protein D3C78_922890 [compost metagenome]
MFQPRITQQRAGGDAGAEADHQGRARFAVVDQQRQQGLDTHIAQRRHGIAGVRHALNVQALECALALPLGDHRHCAAATFLIKRQFAIARPGQQAGELVDRGQPRYDQGQQAQGDHALACAFLHGVATADGDVTDGGGDDRQQPQGAHQAEQGNQQETAEDHADNAAQGVEGHYGTDVLADTITAHAQAQCQGEGGAQQQGRNKHNAQGRDGKAYAHGAQFTGTDGQRGGFTLGLQVDQPATEQRHFEQGQQAGTGNQPAEQPPWIADPVNAPGHPHAAQKQATQVGRQHNGERVGARTHELHDRLRPDHFIAQRDTAGDRVQPQGQACGGGLLRDVNGGFDGCQWLALEPQQGPGGGQQVEHGGGDRTATYAKGGNQYEPGEQGPGDGACGVRRIQMAASLAQVPGIGRQGAHQHRQGPAHQHRRNAYQGKRQHPGHHTDVLLQPGKRAGRQAHAHRGPDTQQRHQHFEPGVEQDRALHAVGQAPEQPATQG